MVNGETVRELGSKADPDKDVIKVDGRRIKTDVTHRYIALYKDTAEIARVYLHPVFSAPKVTFTVALDEGGTLRALAEPTHSAAWEASKNVVVVP